MARINGSRLADDLFGTDLADTIFGRLGDDTIHAGQGDFAFGGKGDDRLSTNPLLDAFDTLLTPDVVLIGGVGNDSLAGFGQLRGDEQAGLPARTVGNDRLTSSMYFDTDLGTQHGGLGSDVFGIGMHCDGKSSEVDVLDFKPGTDKLVISLGYTEGRVEAGGLNQNQIWDVLSGGDGVIDNYSQPDGNAEVWSDVESNRLVIRLHEDYTVIQGVTQINAADWEFF